MPYCVKCNTAMPSDTGLVCDRCSDPESGGAESDQSRVSSGPDHKSPRKFRRPSPLVIAALVIATPLIANAVMVASVVNQRPPDTTSPRTSQVQNAYFPAASAPDAASPLPSNLSPPPLTDAQRAQAEVAAAQARGASASAAPQDAEVPGGQTAGGGQPPAADPVQDERARLVADVLPDYTRQLELDKRVVLHVTGIEYNGSGPGCLATVQFSDDSKTVFTTEDNDAWRVELDNQDSELDQLTNHDDPVNAVDTTGPSTP